MSFSAKDKRLLIFVGVFIAAVLFWRFYLDPQFRSILKLKSELSAGKDKYNLNLEYGEKIKGLDSSLKILNKRLEDLRTEYPPVMNYDEVFMIVTNMAEKSGLTVDGVSFNKISAFSTPDISNDNSYNPEDIVPAQNEDSLNKDNSSSDTKQISELIEELGLDNNSGKAVRDAGKFSVPDGTGYQLGVNIAANGETTNIKKFLSMVENLKSAVSYKDLQISIKDGSVLNFNVTLNFFGIADSNAVNYSMPDSSGWKPLEPAGKSDIFKPYEDYTVNTTPEDADDSGWTTAENLNNTLSDLQKYDFTMRVVPYSRNMAMPVVSLVARRLAVDGSNTVMPVVYGDSQGEEKVSLYLEEKDGKYFCKFKTDQESFPDETYTKLEEFIPAGININMLIDSTVRKFKNDDSTVLVNITNNTKRDLAVKVTGDDRYKPRVKFRTTDQNVKITYN